MLRFVVLLASAGLVLLALASAAHAEPHPAPTSARSSGDRPDEATHPIESPGLIAGGVVVTTVGLAAVPMGSLLALLAESEVVCASAPCPQPDQTATRVAAYGLLSGGLLAIGGGITMMVLGSQADDGGVRVAIAPSGMTVSGRF